MEDYCVEGRSCYYKDVDCTQNNLIVSFRYRNNGGDAVAAGYHNELRYDGGVDGGGVILREVSSLL